MNLEPKHIIEAAGIIGVTLIIFAETGILLGFFLPGDTLLFTAGFLASQGYINLYAVIIATFVAAVVGDSVGYSIGHKLGPRVFVKEDSLLFDKDHIEKAQKFYDKHGGKTIILARFIPVARTFVPVVAGVGKMHYKNFVTYNVVGGAIWTVGVTMLGYYLGSKIPNIDAYILPILALAIIGSFGSSFAHLFVTKKGRKHLKRSLNKYKNKLLKKLKRDK